MKSRPLLVSLIALALVADAVPLRAAEPKATAVPGADAIVTRTLDNGLKVVVWPDHDIPNVAMYTWYRAGGRNEYPGITGMAAARAVFAAGDDTLLVAIGDASKIRDAVGKYGPVTVMKITEPGFAPTQK